MVPMVFNETGRFLPHYLGRRWEDEMDVTRCPTRKKRLMAMTDRTGKTEMLCLKCEKVDPMKTDAAKWADSPQVR
jgi:hypothetical protein